MIKIITSKRYNEMIEELEKLKAEKLDLQQQISALKDVNKIIRSNTLATKRNITEAQEVILKCAAILAPYIERITPTEDKTK